MPDQTTDILTGSSARRKILAGVNKVFFAVRKTIGPAGRNALLPRTYNRGPRITNDGITVAEHARLLPDPHERLAAEAFVEGAKRTNMLAGDGTTGTIVVSGTIINDEFTKVDEDTPTIGGKESTGVRARRQQMKEVKDVVIAKIKEMATPITSLEQLEQIAVISIGVEDHEVAKKVAAMVWEIGRNANGDFVDNFVDVTEGYKGEIETEVIKGMRFPAKTAHRSFLNRPEKFEMVAEQVPVFITNYKLDNPHEFVEAFDRLKITKLAVFAPDFSPSVIKSFQLSIKNSGVFLYPIKTPALRTEQLEDLAVYCNAVVLDKDVAKFSQLTQAHIGYAEKIVVKDTENKEDALLIGGGGANLNEGKKISDRQEILKSQLVEAKNDLSRMQLERRIANLAAAVGIIRVGSSTSGEGLYLKLKIEDGVFACKAALQEGFVKGGGLCLKEIAEELGEDNILYNALIAPNHWIQVNAGGNLEIGDDIIDPAKVIRLEVEHGVSVAATLITADICIPETREKSPAEGYEAIAKAITLFVNLEAYRHGVVKENEDYAEMLRNKEFEAVMLTDNG